MNVSQIEKLVAKREAAGCDYLSFCPENSGFIKEWGLARQLLFDSLGACGFLPYLDLPKLLPPSTRSILPHSVRFDEQTSTRRILLCRSPGAGFFMRIW